MKTKISMIAAVGQRLELGNKNQLLCHLSADLKRFKEITKGHAVIMGDRTWESLPFKPLPHRKNVVLSLDHNYKAPGAEVVHSISDAIEMVNDENEVFIIGGATIYKLFMEVADKLYITKINSEFEADAFFPEIDASWKLTSEETGVEDNGYITDYQIFER